MLAPQVLVSMRPSVVAVLISWCDLFRTAAYSGLLKLKPAILKVRPSLYFGSPLQISRDFDIARSSDMSPLDDLNSLVGRKRSRTVTSICG